MAMAASIETRVPFLDHRLVEFSYKIPPGLKLHGFTEKYILKRAMHDFLPTRTLERKKQRFYVPIDIWIKDDLKPLFEELLSKKNIEKQGYFRHEYIDRIFRNFSRSRLFYGRQLWSLISFQLWHRIFIEGEDYRKII